MTHWVTLTPFDTDVSLTVSNLRMQSSQNPYIPSLRDVGESDQNGVCVCVKHVCPLAQQSPVPCVPQGRVLADMLVAALFVITEKIVLTHR